MKDDLIRRKDAIDAIMGEYPEPHYPEWYADVICRVQPPESLTDDDFEAIRIHLNAYKEKLCNQYRWKEAEEYQRIIDRFMTFASAQRKKGKWIDGHCSNCGYRMEGDTHDPD